MVSLSASRTSLATEPFLAAELEGLQRWRPRGFIRDNYICLPNDWYDRWYSLSRSQTSATVAWLVDGESESNVKGPLSTGEAAYSHKQCAKMSGSDEEHKYQGLTASNPETSQTAAPQIWFECGE